MTTLIGNKAGTTRVLGLISVPRLVRPLLAHRHDSP
jgi:hypothetical protein